MRFFIIHGVYGSPDENWFPWLKEELEKRGHEVIVPKFPTPKGHNLKNWLEIFKKYVDKLDEDTVLIGHSLGCAFILNLLQRYDKKVKATYMIAGFVGPLKLKDLDPLNMTFTERKFDWDKIKQNAGYVRVFASENDPYVKLRKGKELAYGLGTHLTVIVGAGHFNKDAGYTEFAILLKELEDLAQGKKVEGIKPEEDEDETKDKNEDKKPGQ